MAYRGKGGAVNDLVLLDQVDEGKIVECLRNHHSHNEIYTYIGPVLISVNPYRNISGLYGPSKIKKFVLKKAYENNPHVYAIAERAYRNMVSDLSNECVLITGESGSGKTEASKKVMEYVAAMNTSNSRNKEVERVKNQLLESNPLLESFGNAKTVRNDNSSRFGKYMEILFLVGDPAGGNITTYLLEKSRVVFQQKGERNFHIFYELLNDRKFSNEFNLDARSGYNYICDESSSEVDTVDDQANFEDTVRAMKYIGLDSSEQKNIFSLVAFLLHLGNCTIKSAGGKVTDKDALRNAADLAGVDVKTLENALTHRTIKETKSNLNTSQSANARDSMAKSVYNKLFGYIVKRANEAIKCDKFSTSIGVLDIYGFEILGVNGFEQLCINYTNEKLHQLFIELTLKAEQEEYKKEGIEWQKVTYFNNKKICTLIEKNMFTLVKDECTLGGGNDNALFKKMERNLRQEEFQVYGKAANQFQVRHYAGDVLYSVNNFVETNRDTLSPDIVQCMLSSSNPVAKVLFEGHPAANRRAKANKKPPPTCIQYKKNVQELMDDLSRCNQHYIRCIKPNESKAGSLFEDDLVTVQCRYLGVLESVRVRRAGYAFRMSYDRFAAKYKCVLKDSSLQAFNPNAQDLTRMILSENVKGSKAYEFGKSKVFIKDAASILSIEDKRKAFLQLAQSYLPAEESGLIFADKVMGFNEKFQKNNLTFCVGGSGFYWYANDGSVAQFFPMEKIEYIGYNKGNGWMTVNTTYPSKQEDETVHLSYLSENIYGANVKNFAEVMKSMGYDKITARETGSYPNSATDAVEYKALVKQIAKGEKKTVARGAGPQAEGCCCVVS